MATCVGCGAELAPEWKYCIHCGIAADAHEIPSAIRPEPASAPPTATRRPRRLIVGIIVIVAIVVILGVVIAVLAGSLA
jgi:hypothetical protein